MAGVDASIYFQQQAPDIFGTVQRGLSMRDMIDQRNKIKAVDEAYKAGMSIGPDGKPTFDEQKTISSLAGSGLGKQAYEARQQFQAQDLANQKAKQEKLYQQFDFVGRAAPNVVDQNSYDQFLGQAKQLGLDTSMYPPQFGPDAQQKVNYYGGMALSHKDRMDQSFKQQDLDIRRAEVGNKREERIAAREERAQKQADISAAQAKQLGLYQSGQEAEAQYAKATENPDEFNPTNSGQWIDNSSWAPNLLKNKKAIEAQSAKDAWIESYLRDASGAAIAPSERGAYADIYFPAPGDTEAVVANKARLRQQKAQSALVGSGRAGSQIASQQKVEMPQNKVITPAQHPQTNDAVMWAMQRPNDPKAKEILRRNGFSPGKSQGGL